MGFLKNRRNKIINKEIKKAILQRGGPGYFVTGIYYAAAEQYVIGHGGRIIDPRSSRVNTVIDGIEYRISFSRAGTGYTDIVVGRV